MSYIACRNRSGTYISRVVHSSIGLLLSNEELCLLGFRREHKNVCVHISEHDSTISVHSEKVDGYRQILHDIVFESSGKHGCTQFQSWYGMSLRMDSLCFSVNETDMIMINL